MASSITELKSTLFLTPVISTLFKWFSIGMMKVIGWRIAGEKPSYPKYILAAAPHTSNWDFGLLVLVCFSLRLDAHWMGKDALFMQPFKRLMIWLGGIPIDRSKANNVVDQMSDYFHSVEKLAVIIPPEGTRSKVERWKTGFYHIAIQSEVPVVLAFIDASTKEVGFGPTFIPTGDLEKDMLEIREFYKTKTGINPQNS